MQVGRVTISRWFAGTIAAAFVGAAVLAPFEGVFGPVGRVFLPLRSAVDSAVTAVTKPLPKPQDEDDYTIVVADLQGDADGTQSDRLATLIAGKFPNPAGTLPVRVVRYPRTLRIDTRGDMTGARSRAEVTGRAWLKRVNGDLLVWGVIHPQSRELQIRLILASDAVRSPGWQFVDLGTGKVFDQVDALKSPPDLRIAITDQGVHDQLPASVAASLVRLMNHGAVTHLYGDAFDEASSRAYIARIQSLIDQSDPPLDTSTRANLLSDVGLAYSRIGKEKQDIAAFQAAAAAFHRSRTLGAEPPIIVHAQLLNEARARLDVAALNPEGGLESALEGVRLAREAATLSPSPPGAYNRANGNLELARALRTLATFPQHDQAALHALPFYRKSLEGIPRGSYPNEWARVHLEIAEIVGARALARLDWTAMDTAMKDYLQALAVFDSTASEERISIYIGLGRLTAAACVKQRKVSSCEKADYALRQVINATAPAASERTRISAKTQLCAVTAAIKGAAAADREVATHCAEAAAYLAQQGDEAAAGDLRSLRAHLLERAEVSAPFTAFGE